MSTGTAEAYISKGMHTLPSESHFLIKRHTDSDQIMTISQDNIRPGQILAGDYIIGIRGIGLINKFHITYQSSDFQLLTLPTGIPITQTIRQDKVLYLEIFSDGAKADIELSFKTKYARLEMYALARPDHHSAINKGTKDLPTAERYSWNYTAHAEGSYGKLIIDSNHSRFCTYCSYIVMVRSSTADKVDFLVKKRTNYSLTRILEGKTYVDILKQGEYDTYQLRVPSNESIFSIDLNVHKGSVTFMYSPDEKFPEGQTYKVANRSKNEFLSTNFGKVGSFFRSIFRKDILRYIRVVGEAPDSEYSFSVVSNNMLTEISHLVPRHSMLLPGGDHYYYFPSAESEEIDLTFHLRSIVNMQDPDFESVAAQLPKLVKFYYASTLKEVEKRTYDYEIKSQNHLYRHQMRYNLRTKAGYTMIVVHGGLGRPITFTLELSRFNTKQLSTTHDTVDFVDSHVKKYYFASPEESGDIVKIRIDQCLGSIHANYALISNKAVSRQTNENLQWKPYINSEVRHTFIRTSGEEIVKLKIEKVNVTSIPSSMSSQSELLFNQNLPSVYALNYELHMTSINDNGVSGMNSLVLGNLEHYGDVEVFADSDQNIRFQGLTFYDDFLAAHADHYVLINYTLYISQSFSMLMFMKRCGFYQIELAEQHLGTNSHYVYSIQEYYALNVSDKRKEPPILKIRPHMLSFSGRYHGVVVAEIRMWKDLVVSRPNVRTVTVFLRPKRCEPSTMNSCSNPWTSPYH